MEEAVLKELGIFVHQFPEVFGMLPELDKENPLVTLLVDKKNKQMPPIFFSSHLKKDIILKQEVSAPIIPY